jgi:hypothetical protein
MSISAFNLCQYLYKQNNEAPSAETNIVPTAHKGKFSDFLENGNHTFWEPSGNLPAS